ncbi:MAG: TetR/AcrR family transcriptional regulator [Candidatus Nanopelagicales bacterium]|jgi:AcrR family transcriptional regulator
MNQRAYSMEVRAARAEETRARIVAVAQEQFADPAADITLEGVAAAAGVSVRTVLRAFGTKEGLVLAAIDTMRADSSRPAADPPESPEDAVRQVFDDYESIGDRVVRMLADEHRIAGFAEVAAEGRERHRAWLAAAFARDLAAYRGRDRSRRLDALVAATDVYLWKLLRRDLGRSRADAERVVVQLVHGALGRAEG